MPISGDNISMNPSRHPEHTTAGAATPAAGPTSTLRLEPRYRQAAAGVWIALIIVCLLWEGVVAPLKPGGSWMILKALPLLLPLQGLLRGRVYTFQWAAMLAMPYMMEGAVRLWSDRSPTSAIMAACELVLTLAFVVLAILYVRPSKLHHKKQKQG